MGKNQFFFLLYRNYIKYVCACERRSIAHVIIIKRQIRAMLCIASYLLVNAFIFVVVAVIGARALEPEKINSVVLVKRE